MKVFGCLISLGPLSRVNENSWIFGYLFCCPFSSGPMSPQGSVKMKRGTLHPMVCYFSCVRQIFLLQFSRTRATEWRLIYYIRGNVISNQPSAMQPRRHLIPVFVEGTGCFGKGKYWLVYAGKWASAWPGVWHVKFLPFCWVQFSKNRWWRTCGEIYHSKMLQRFVVRRKPTPGQCLSASKRYLEWHSWIIFCAVVFVFAAPQLP